MTELNTGNSINYWGPQLTPYALAIAEHYEQQIPYFVTVPTQLTNTTREEKVFIIEPNQYDALIVGAHIDIGSVSNGDFGQLALMQVTHLQTGLTWTTPGPMDATPATAYGGSKFNAMPVLKLPDAFFLPAHTRLKHLWRSQGLITGGVLTWIGVRLINPKRSGAPAVVTMPDGSVIRVGSRIPWLCTIGLGTEISILGSQAFVLGAGNIYTQYTPPMDCDIEIHDICANWFTQSGVDANAENVLVSIADKGEGEFWTPGRVPATAFMGDFNLAYPGLPFTKPYLLKKGHRLQITTHNTNSSAINNALITVRGVRKCMY